MGSKTVVDWINSKTREKTVGGAIWSTRGWSGGKANMEGWESDLAVHIFREHKKDADVWAEKDARGEKKEWQDKGVVE